MCVAGYAMLPNWKWNTRMPVSSSAAFDADLADSKPDNIEQQQNLPPDLIEIAVCKIPMFVFFSFISFSCLHSSQFLTCLPLVDLIRWYICVCAATPSPTHKPHRANRTECNLFCAILRALRLSNGSSNSICIDSIRHRTTLSTFECGIRESDLGG